MMTALEEIKRCRFFIRFQDVETKRGFTVLELLAVFAMLAIIVSLIAPKYQGLILDSKVKACQSNVQMITKAAKMYYEVHNEWPR